MRTRAVILTAVFSLFPPISGGAGETIVDPENPDPPSSSDDAGDDESSERDDEDDSRKDDEDDEGGSETIFDPENPDPPESPDGREREDDAEEREAGTDDGDQGGGGGSESATKFRGRWGTSVAVDTDWVDARNEDVVEWSGAVDLRLTHEFDLRTELTVEGEFRHWIGGRENPRETDLLINAARPRASFEGRLGEAYVVHRGDDWTVQAGHIVTHWGNTDLVRPGDVVNPGRLTDLSIGGGGDTLVPQLGVEVGRVAPNWSLSAVVIPFFKPNRVTVFGRDTAVGVPQNPLVGEQFPVVSVLEDLVDPSLYEEAQPLALAGSQPDELPKNMSAGLRFEGTRWNTDFGLGFFSGWDRTPWLRIDEDLEDFARLVIEDGQVLSDFDFAGFIGRNPEALELADRLSEKRRRGESLVESEYRRRHTLVADVARYVGPIGVRADMAISPERTFVTRDLEAVRRPTFFGALGLSWERLSADRPMAVTVEGFWLHPFGRDTGITRTFVSDRERGPDEAELALIGSNMWGVAGAFNWTGPWDLELQLGAVATVSNGDVVATGRVKKSWTDWLNTGIGAAVFEGPDPAETLSLGGIYDRNDQVVVTVDGKF